MTGSNPTDRSGKLGTKRHILTDKNGIPLSAVIASASTHDIKAVTDVIDNIVNKRPSLSSFTKTKITKQNHALIGHTIPKRWNRRLSNGDMCLIHHTREKEERRKRTKIKHSKKSVVKEGGGW